MMDAPPEMEHVMAYWLLKTEPSTYSFADLARQKTATWDGVANPAALKNMRSMQPGDEVFIYHTGDEKQIVGTATVTKAAYPDPKQSNERMVVIDLRVGEPVPQPVTLAQIKSDKRFADWDLTRLGRLSVVPTTAAEWNAVMRLAGVKNK
jgi:predicted RNA-binding protein with PUA-like domain